MYDLIIIGAGPAGIMAAYEAKKARLDYLVIEKGLLANTIYNYPVGLTVFSTTNEIEFNEGELKPAREKPTREELLSYYVRFVLDNELNIHTEEKVLGIKKSSPPYKGGVAAASADGVVFPSANRVDRVDTQRKNHPVAEAATPLLRKEGSFRITTDKGVYDART